MKILVAGGLGFIGTWVTKKLIEQGHECIVLDNVCDYGIIPRDELNELIDERKRFINAPFKHLQISITEELAQIPAVDAVIHLASFPRQKIVQTDPVSASDIMIKGLLNLVRYSIDNNIKRFVYISSSLVYGDHRMFANELDNCRPQGEYAIMKYAGEMLINDYARRGLISAAVIRPCAVYGEYDIKDRVVSKFIYNALANKPLEVHGPNQILDFTHVDDASTGIILAALSNVNGTFNISHSSNQLRLSEVANLIIELTDSTSVLIIKEHDSMYPRRDLLGITSAREVLKYFPSIPLTHGLRNYIDWVKRTIPAR
jgi:nucleoside-diphosphate-sugar epimerase